VRSIASGIYPPLLADLGLTKALRAQAARAGIPVSLIGSVPRGTAHAEEAVYFSCSEAIQNASKHARRSARMTLWLHHHDRTLTALITDDGRGSTRLKPPEVKAWKASAAESRVLAGAWTSPPSRDAARC
jgi:signal transduction histidine kinase